MRRIASVGLGWFEIGNERSKLEEYAFIFLSVDLFEILEIDLETELGVNRGWEIFGLRLWYLGLVNDEIIAGNIDPFLLHEFVHFFFLYVNEYLLVWNVNVTEPVELIFFFCAIIKNVQVFLTKLILVFIQTEKIIITFD